LPAHYGDVRNALETKRVGSGLLLQSADNHELALADLKIVTVKQPTPEQLHDLLFAWKVAKFVKSNAIVFCKNGMTMGVGAGQMSRLDSARIASIKPKDRLRAWIHHVLAATSRHAGQADWPKHTTLLGKRDKECFRQLTPDTAHTQLRLLVTGYQRGLSSPLPVLEQSSCAYGEAWAKKSDDVACARAARRAFFPQQSDAFDHSDSAQPEIQLCWRGRDPLGTQEFADWARRLWAVVHEHTEKA
jgi:AICAR transformylase/IMP cyclohydrolase PurH